MGFFGAGPDARSAPDGLSHEMGGGDAEQLGQAVFDLPPQIWRVAGKPQAQSTVEVAMRAGGRSCVDVRLDVVRTAIGVEDDADLILGGVDSRQGEVDAASNDEQPHGARRARLEAMAVAVRAAIAARRADDDDEAA